MGAPHRERLSETTVNDDQEIRKFGNFFFLLYVHVITHVHVGGLSRSNEGCSKFKVCAQG